MRRRMGFAAAAGLLLMTAACVSFKLRPPPLPVNRVEALFMCASVEESGELLKPGEEVKGFDPAQDGIICFLRLEEVDRRIMLRWRWYSPEQKLIKDTGPVEVNLEEKYLAVVTAYDKLDWDPDAEPAGVWTVIVSVDGDLIGRRSFGIKSGDPPPGSAASAPLIPYAAYRPDWRGTL